MTDTVTVRIKITRALYENIMLDSQINGGPLIEEIIRKLNYSLRYNDHVMWPDELQRLIFERKLAHKGPRKNQTPQTRRRISPL